MCVAGPDQISNEYADVNDAALAATVASVALAIGVPDASRCQLQMRERCM